MLWIWVVKYWRSSFPIKETVDHITITKSVEVLVPCIFTHRRKDFFYIISIKHHKRKFTCFYVAQYFVLHILAIYFQGFYLEVYFNSDRADFWL